MSNRPWLSSYPAGVPAEVNVNAYNSLVQLMEESFQKFGSRTAYSFMGKELSFADADTLSQALAAYFQGLGLQKGDRIAIMMPNVPQYPITVAAILRAGFVVVNVNPLYTPRELEHQLKDSGSKAIVIIENFATTLDQCIKNTPIKHVVLAAMGDRLGLLKGMLVNYVVRNVKKMVPAFNLPGAVRFNDALAKGTSGSLKKPELKPDDVAVLQYTGGTTGVSKGAVLLHRNIIANVLQSEAWNAPGMKGLPAGEQPVGVVALPLYHIFAFTVNMMLGMRQGGKGILIPNPRDLPAVLKELSKHRIHTFPAVNTLFNGLANHPDFNTVDWSHLKISVGGGMAVQGAVADLWLRKTGCSICEGYGLSETSPSVTCNPTDSKSFTGTIGLPIPGTDLKCLGDDGQDVPLGQPGEIAVKGPQVMAGYWQRPDETAKVMTPDGFFKTGDIGVMDERGYIKIVDRKKDMILVSGFNVYPNELEDVVAKLAGVMECAAVGVMDDKTGEAIKLVIVKKNESLTAEQVKEHCRANLTGYKQPKIIEFRKELPKTPVGKILRRELRDKYTEAFLHKLRHNGSLTPAIFFAMTTAIISALPEEQAGLAALLLHSEQLTMRPRPLLRGLIHGHSVILALAGIGKVAAATTATMLIERHAVQRIIFTGVAGAVAPHVQVGDVVVGSQYLQHDMDASPLFPRHEIPLYGRSRFDAEMGLIAMLLEATKLYSTGANGHKPRKEFNTHCGLIVSGDRFVSSAAEVQALRQELPDALCVEMEGAAIAQVCHDYQLPFAAMRTISDKADDNAHVDFPKFVAEVAGPYAVGIMDALMQQL